MSYMPREIRNDLDDLQRRLDSFENDVVAKWGNDEKIVYYQSKMEMIQSFILDQSGSTTTTTTSTDTSNNTSSDSNDTVKKIMNEVFKQVRSEFDSGSYSGAQLLDGMKSIIVKTTLSTAENADEDTLDNVKKIMNNVFKTLKGLFQDNTNYGADQIVQGVKDTIVETTTSLLQGGNDTSNSRTTNNNTSNSNTNYRSNTTNTSKTTKNTPKKEPVKTTTYAPRSEPKVNNAPKPSNTDLNIRSTSDSPGMVVARRDAEERVNQNRDVDLSHPDILEGYLRTRDDEDSINWIVLNYKGTKEKLFVAGYGSGGVAEMMDEVDEAVPNYMYFCHEMGDTNRPRFVFMAYVPENLNGLQKSRALRHRAPVQEFLKFFTLTWHLLDLDDFSIEELEGKLTAASGANYSVQTEDKGDFGSYKTKTSNFYKETERSGSQMEIVYETGPLSTTACDISGRSTVAPASAFLANTSNSMKQRNF